MAAERVGDRQKRLLPLTVVRLLDGLCDQFLELFDPDLLKKDSGRDSFRGTSQQLGAVVGEFLTLAEMMSVDVEKAVWYKYPRKCPYCAAAQCKCGEHKRHPHSRLHVRFPKEGFTIGEVQRMLAHIYPPRSVQEQVLKVVEEIEEAKREIEDDGKNRDMQDEFADVFARMAALATHLEIDLEEVVP